MPSFLYSTDHHFRDTNPVNRKDIFLDSLCEKLEEFIEIANEREVGTILLGGDVFNSYSPPPKVVKKVIQILKKFPRPIYSIIGNHEIPGNLSAASDKMLGLLKEFNDFPIRYFDFDNVFSKQVIAEIPIIGINYYSGIEDYLKMIDKPVKEGTILLAHANIVDKPCPFPDYCLMQELKLPAQFVFCSHYHPALGVVQNSHGNIFISPGAFSRGSISTGDVERIPGIAYLEITKNSFSHELIPLKSAKPSEEIFDLETIELYKEKKANIEDFINTVRLTELELTDLHSMVLSLANDLSLDKELITLATDRLNQAINGEIS